MKRLSQKLVVLAAAAFVLLLVIAASPSFQNFDITQFNTSNNRVRIKDGSLQTNTIDYGSFGIQLDDLGFFTLRGLAGNVIQKDGVWVWAPQVATLTYSNSATIPSTGNLTLTMGETTVNSITDVAVYTASPTNQSIMGFKNGFTLLASSAQTFRAYSGGGVTAGGQSDPGRGVIESTNLVKSGSLELTNNIGFQTNAWANAPTGAVDLSISEQASSSITAVSVTGVLNKSTYKSQGVTLKFRNTSATNWNLTIGGNITTGDGQRSYIATNGMTIWLTLKHTPGSGADEQTNAVVTRFW